MSSFADIAIGRRAHADHRRAPRPRKFARGFGTVRSEGGKQERVLAAKRGPAPDTIFAEARSFLAPRTEAAGGKSEAICEAGVRRGSVRIRLCGTHQAA